MRGQLNGVQDRETLIALAQVYEKGQTLCDMGKALDVAEKLSQNKDDKETVYLHARRHVRAQKKYSEAEADFRRVLEINPTNAEALNYLGYMLADRGVRLDEATRSHQEGGRPGTQQRRVPRQPGLGLFPPGQIERGPGPAGAGAAEYRRGSHRPRPPGRRVLSSWARPGSHRPMAGILKGSTTAPDDADPEEVAKVTANWTTPASRWPRRRSRRLVRQPGNLRAACPPARRPAAHRYRRGSLRHCIETKVFSLYPNFG